MADWTKIDKELDIAESEPFLEKGFLQFGFLSSGSYWIKISKAIDSWTKISIATDSWTKIEKAT